MNNELNLHQLALRGRVLIEASAGTGKTYSLAALYVRLVAGLGETAFEQGLSPQQILVLTFTRAATQELRHRIRQRLQETADFLANHSAGIEQQGDDFLLKLLAEIDESQRDIIQKRCQLAANSMDMAAIYTIHGFCQRSLKRFAFASGQNFEQVLETDTQSLFKNAQEDYWRRFFQNQSEMMVSVLLDEKISSIGDLAKLIKDKKIRAEEGVEQTDLPSSFLQYEETYLQLKQIEQTLDLCFIEEKKFLLDWFEDNKGNLNGQKINKTFITELASSSSITEVRKNYQTYLTEQGINTCWKKDKQQALPKLAIFKQMQFYLTAKEEAAFPLQELLQHAANWIKAEQERQLQAAAMMSFDTMISALANALDKDKSLLYQALKDQLFEAYPCTLIDEFQDTDSQQYAIFKAMYEERDESDFAWLMIGDPKQAIYSFRGADIETYIEAKNETPTHKTLATNYRSSANVIKASNGLFLNSPLNQTEGGVFNRAEIPFVEVNHREEKDDDIRLFIEDAPLTHGIELLFPEQQESFSTGSARSYLARFFAKKVALLLNEAQQGQHYFADNVSRETSKTAIKPSDITLLVRNRTEADELKQALKRYGVESVFLSEKNSVFNQAEARDLVAILKAVINYNDSGLLRTALASPSLNYSWQQQYDLQHNEAQWQALLIQFKKLKQLWQRSGPLPMLYRLLDMLNVTQRQASERVYTNLFHLAELIQSQVKTLKSVEAQLNYLEVAIYDEKQGDEDNSELLIRLENERNLVKIMTLHKSKGLEFPIVFIPFATLCLGDSWQADIDEEMRLLYVGITRAKYLCYLGLIKNKHGRTKDDNHLYRSTLGRLLFGENENKPVADSVIEQQLTQLQQNHSTILLNQTTLDEYIKPYQETAELPLYLEPNELLQVKNKASYWGVSSYSAISRRKTLLQEVSLSEDRSVDDEGESFIATEASLSSSEIHQFPKGRHTGNLLHDLLEQCCNKGFDKVFQSENYLENLTEKCCQTEFWQEHKSTLLEWLNKLLSTPLQIEGKTLALADLTSSETLAETEFWLQTPELDLQRLNLLTAQFVGQESNQDFSYQQLNGMLKGFIDLVFYHEGKYYVLDYKTNYLGATHQAYSQAAMQQAMIEHRYDLQGIIYQQALHYLLASRLADYSPEKHLGGCYFFFLRGIESDNHGLLHLPVNIEVIQEMERLFPK